MLTNEQLRKHLLQKRRDFRQNPLYEKYCADICERIIRSEVFQRARNVMFYLPLGGEADIRRVYRGDKNFCVPVTKGVDITPAVYTPQTSLAKGEYSVTEPKDPAFIQKDELDLVLIPLVGADRNRNRIGFGKGCYDRFLKDMDCFKAGVAFGFQIIDDITPQKWDVPLDCIFTERECI